ncbi:MAG: NAD-dependent epimerase/dehydratase family protein [Bacteroidales bacterium]
MIDSVLVTGANGLLGTNVVLDLLEQGYGVKALVRNPKSMMQVEHANYELVKGDITNKDRLIELSKNCNYVIHTAANTSQNLLKAEAYDEVNLHGTQNVIDACKVNNIKRLVYVGTANTYGYGSLDDLGNEEKAIKYPFTKSNYAISKTKVQALVDKEADNIDLITISPTFMIGAYDSKPSSGKIILMVLNKKIVFYPSGGKNFVHVKDVSLAAVKALKQGQRGEKYLLANENMCYRDFFRLVAKRNNQKTSFINVPRPILLLAGMIGSGIRCLGFPISLSYTNTRILTINNYYSNKKAKEGLGMEFRSTESAVDDAIWWFADR